MLKRPPWCSLMLMCRAKVVVVSSSFVMRPGFRVCSCSGSSKHIVVLRPAAVVRVVNSSGRQGDTCRQGDAAMSSRGRSIFAGSHGDLAEILQKHAVVADFVDYPEPTNKKAGVRLDVAKIMKSQSLFADLLALQPNMAFQKKRNRRGSREGVD